MDTDAVDRIVEQWQRVRPGIDTRPMEVFGRVYRIARLMGDHMETVYAKFGIDRGRFDVLATLRRAGEPYTLSPKEMIATMMLTSGGMTGRLDRLERAGLITRAQDPDDRRGQKVTLTAEGLQLIDEAWYAGLQAQAEALGVVADEDAEHLSELLRVLLKAVG